MGAIHAQRGDAIRTPAVKQRLLAELHNWERQLVVQSLNEAIRLMQSKKAEKLTAHHLHAIAEYGAIQIDEEVFFAKAFTSGKDVAACLGLAMQIGWQEALDDIVRFRLTVMGPDVLTSSGHSDTGDPRAPHATGSPCMADSP
jgi:hypothetical protein